MIRLTRMGMTSTRGFAVVLFASSLLAHAADSQWIVLWPNGAPGSENKIGEETVRTTPQGEHVTANVHRPSIGVFLLSGETADGAAVVIAPGGGQSELWADHEGVNVAGWLADHGVAGVVLKYRLAREKGSTYMVDVESLADMQRAIRLVRSRASEWGIDPERVGVMGSRPAVKSRLWQPRGSAQPDAGCSSRTSKALDRRLAHDVIVIRLVPNWFSRHQITGSLPTHSVSIFLQRRSRGAK